MSHKRLLIIDDDEAIQLIVKFGIDIAAGWEVISASAGNLGIEIAKRELPDAILLDVMMPGIDGIATCRALQTDRITTNIPVILMTASIQTAQSSQFHDLGISGIIAKPFNALDLPTQISKILHW
jgi:CheY-like chemotaxis protein